jgi:hypothetical protein
MTGWAIAMRCRRSFAITGWHEASRACFSTDIGRQVIFPDATEAQLKAAELSARFPNTQLTVEAAFDPIAFAVEVERSRQGAP